jgi:hypothetical protein
MVAVEITLELAKHLITSFCRAVPISTPHAALRLKNGSCEDDEPSRNHESRCRAPLPKKMILLFMILSKFRNFSRRSRVARRRNPHSFQKCPFY